jgi:type VI protein secretion system component VasK
LLALFCVVSRNTAVEVEEVAQVFQPAQFVTPEGCQDKLTAESNAEYMNNLIQLQASLQQVAENAGNDALRSGAVQAATSAQVSTRQMGQNFRIDSEGKTHETVQKLLNDPITYAQNALLGAPVDAINAAGRGFCASIRPLMAKYPFQAKASTKATLAEVGGIFQPATGALWRLYQENLTEILVQQGDSFVPGGAGPVAVTSGYQNYFRRMAAVSAALYASGSQQPNLSFSLSPLPSDGVEGITLTINGNTVSSGGAKNQPWQFAWPGAGPHEARLSVKLAGGSELAYFNFTGLWSIFEMLATADSWGTTGSQFQVEWRLRTSVGEVQSPKTGRPVIVRLRLDMQGAPPILQPGYFSALGCEPTIARRR